MERLAVYPNPATDYLNLDLSAWEGQTLRVQVWNARGQQVLEQAVAGGSPAYRLELPAAGSGGLQALRVLTESGGAYGARFVREGF